MYEDKKHADPYAKKESAEKRMRTGFKARAYGVTVPLHT
jgi:hypothetical protein